MDSAILSDINTIEEIDFRLSMVNARYSAAIDYAECLRLGFSKLPRSGSDLSPKQKDAISSMRETFAETQLVAYSNVFDEVTPFVWGCKDAGVFADSCVTLDNPIQFWERLWQNKKRRIYADHVLLEAYIAALYIYARNMKIVYRDTYSKQSSLRTQFNMLTQVEKAYAAAAEIREAFRITSAAARKQVECKANCYLLDGHLPKTQSQKPVSELFRDKEKVMADAFKDAEKYHRSMSWKEACLKSYGEHKRDVDHHGLWRQRDGGGFSVQAMVRAVKRRNTARQEQGRIARAIAPDPALPRAR